MLSLEFAIVLLQLEITLYRCVIEWCWLIQNWNIPVINGNINMYEVNPGKMIWA